MGPKLLTANLAPNKPSTAPDMQRHRLPGREPVAPRDDQAAVHLGSVGELSLWTHRDNQRPAGSRAAGAAARVLWLSCAGLALRSRVTISRAVAQPLARRRTA